MHLLEVDGQEHEPHAADGEAADAGLAVVDIFRTDGRAILEHWDVLMEVPANPVNTNPLF